MRDVFLFSILIGFVGGIFFRSFFNLGQTFYLFLILISWAIFMFFLLGNPKEKEKIIFVSLLFLSAGIGVWRFDLTDFKKTEPFLNNFLNQNVSIDAFVTDEPDTRESNTQLKLKIHKLNGEEIETKSNILAIVDQYPQYNYGDLIQVGGILNKPKNFNADGERQFDYVSYLAKDNINYQIFYPKTKFVSSGNGNFIKEKLFRVKNIFIEQSREIFPEPHSSLLSGLIIGAKESLGKDLQDDFRKVGLIHIVVLSGYNITIIADFIMGLFSFLPGLFSVFVGAVSIIFFAIMTGASATIVRASVMALLVLLARATGRVNEITRTLFLAGFLMVLHNPTILVFDASFQLSFMATFGLIFLSPKIENYFSLVPEKFKIKESLVSVISTQIFVLPLLLYMMGDFSVVSVPVNLLVLTFIPFTMLFGFLSIVVGLFSAVLATPFSYIAYGLLSYELKVVEFFSSLPFASIHIPIFSVWFMVVAYLFVFLFFSKIKTPEGV